MAAGKLVRRPPTGRPVDPIVERARWTVAGRAAFARLTRAEAERLVDIAGPRDDLQDLLLELRSAFPTLEGLLVYVLDAERVVGFAELLIETEQFRWTGPHLAP